MTKHKQITMNYQQFILEALKIVNNKPTKDEMQFAYLVCYNVFGMSIEESIKESMKLS